MERVWSNVGNIAASGNVEAFGVIPLVRARTLSITTRLLCGAALNANPQIDLFYSPDGNNWDTLAYATATMTFTVATTIQRTIILDPPEHGYMKVRITNTSAADVLTNVRFWYSIQAWPPEPSQSRGDMSTKTIED